MGGVVTGNELLVCCRFSFSCAHIPPQSRQFVLLFSLSYYPHVHTSATVNHLQAPPPCNTPSTQTPLNQTPQTTNCYPTQNVFPFLLFLYCMSQTRKPQLTSVQQSSIFSHTWTAREKKRGAVCCILLKLCTQHSFSVLVVSMFSFSLSLPLSLSLNCTVFPLHLSLTRSVTVCVACITISCTVSWMDKQLHI